MKTWPLFCVAAAFTAAPVAPSFATDAQSVGDAEAVRFASYRQIENALMAGAAPEAWDAAAYVSQAAITDLVKLLVGAKVSIPARAGRPAADIVVNTVDLNWDVGAIRTQLSLTAGIAGAFADFDVVADALFVVQGFEAEADEPDKVFLVVSPKIVTLAPKNPALALAATYVPQLLGLGTVADLEERLRVRIPLRNTFSYSTTLHQSTSTKVDNGTVISFSLDSPGGPLSSILLYRAITTGDGVWALAKRAAEGAAVADTAAEQPIPDQAKLDEMRDLLTGRLSSFAARDTALAFYFSNGIVRDLAAQYNAISSQARVITLQSTGVTGRLYEDHWSDNLLGDGGVFVDLAGPDAASAAASIGDINESWQGNSATAALSVPINVAAQASLNVHVDPFVGGGATATAHLVGSAAASLQATAAFAVLAVENTNGLWLVPDVPCQSIPVTVMTDGPLSVGPIAASLPSIGARFHTTIGKDALKPLPIIDTLPHRYRIIPAEQPADKAILALATKADAVELTFGNLALTSAAEGVWLGADVAVSLATMNDAPAPATPDQLAEKAHDALQKARAACADDSHVEILIDGIELGQIIDPAKLFATAAKALGDAAEDARREAERIAEQALEEARRQAEAVVQAAQQAAIEADRLRREAEEEARRILSIPIPHIDLPHIDLNPF